MCGTATSNDDRFFDGRQAAEQLLKMRELGFKIIALGAVPCSFDRPSLRDLYEKKRRLQRIDESAAAPSLRIIKYAATHSDRSDDDPE